MVTVHILYATFGKLQARMAIFSIKIDATTSRDIYDLSNGLNAMHMMVGNKKEGLCDFSHNPSAILENGYRPKSLTISSAEPN